MSHPENPTPIALDARATLRELLEPAERALPRLKASLNRTAAGEHVQTATRYLAGAGAHLGVAASSVAWALAHVDAAGGKSLLPALERRWTEVRCALPEGIAKVMPERWGRSA